MLRFSLGEPPPTMSPLRIATQGSSAETVVSRFDPSPNE